MNPILVRTFGWVLTVVGVLIAVFSGKIVFPALELVLGIENIVGKDNVIYRDDGTYIFTNPGAMVKWIVAVASLGALVSLVGLLLLIRSRTKRPD